MSVSQNFLLCRRFIPLSCHIQSICMGFDSQLSFPEINYVKRLCYRDSMKQNGKNSPEHDAERGQMSLEPAKCCQDPLTFLRTADKQFMLKFSLRHVQPPPQRPPPPHTVLFLKESALGLHFSKLVCHICGF